MYIYELEGWPDFSWDQDRIAEQLIQLREEIVLQTLTQDVVKSSEIEGEILDRSQVRSSVARRLGIDVAAIDSIVQKTHFWEAFAKVSFNERQRKVINRLLDRFKGKLTSTKWAKIAKCSQDTAYRDILDLVDRGILIKNPEGGRSSSYSLIMPSFN